MSPFGNILCKANQLLPTADQIFDLIVHVCDINYLCTVRCRAVSGHLCKASWGSLLLLYAWYVKHFTTWRNPILIRSIFRIGTSSIVFKLSYVYSRLIIMPIYLIILVQLCRVIFILISHMGEIGLTSSPKINTTRILKAGRSYKLCMYIFPWYPSIWT